MYQIEEEKNFEIGEVINDKSAAAVQSAAKRSDDLRRLRSMAQE